MKKSVFSIIAVVAFGLGAVAQNPVFTFGATSPIPASYIPAAFMSNQQPGIATVTLNFDDPINSTLTVYNNEFQTIGSSIAVPLTTTNAGSWREEILDQNTGEWVNRYEDEYEENAILAPVITPYVEIGNSGIEAVSVFAVSQILFNQDADIEYLVPVVSTTTEIEGPWQTEYYDETTGQWRETLYRDVKTKVEATGFNIIKAGGAVAGTITLPTGYTVPAVEDDGVVVFAVAIAKFLNSYYIVVPATNEDADNEMDEVKVFVYSVTPGSGVQSINLVSEELPINIFPTMVNQGNDITVDLGDNSNARQIQVIDQTGRVVKTMPVQAGQRQVKVNTGNINPGVNFINALCGKQSSSYKVIVR